MQIAVKAQDRRSEEFQIDEIPAIGDELDLNGDILNGIFVVRQITLPGSRIYPAPRLPTLLVDQFKKR